MNSLFKYLREPLEWLRKHKESSAPVSVPEPEKNLIPRDDHWPNEIISVEKMVFQAASQGLSMTQYRDFVISSLDSLLLNNGAQTINEVGVNFDNLKHRPNVAIEVPEGATVSSVLQAGIIFNGRVLKRATVEFTMEK